MLVTVTVAVDLVCAVLAFLFERHEAQTEIHTFGSALFWTSTQLLTVSSNLQNPISAPGRVLDVLMEIYAITVVAALAGSFASFLHRRSLERAPHRPAGEAALSARRSPASASRLRPASAPPPSSGTPSTLRSRATTAGILLARSPRP